VRGAARWLLVVLVVLGGLYTAAWTTTDRSGISRAVVWLEADTGDLHRFPSRIIPAGDEPFPLPPGPPLDLTGVWPGGGDPTEVLDASGTAAFLVVQDGRLIYERYGEGTDAAELRTSFSVAKSIVSTLVGLAIEDGAIGSLDDPVTAYVPELAERDPRAEAITLRHLLTMSSGLRYVERSLPWSDDARTYYSTDLRGTALSARVDHEPGTRFLYNNYNLLLEGLVLERATGERVADYASRRLWGPLGAEADASWSLDSDRHGFEKMESGFNAVARDYARFGLLFTRGGEIDGRQVVPRAWVEEATSAAASGSVSPSYALHWWTGTFEGSVFPEGHALAAGNHGQFVYIAPDRDLVLVRLGDGYGDVAWPQLLTELAQRL
jgi:CubicO group peptidase (beta-lactamase class C family)